MLELKWLTTEHAESTAADRKVHARSAPAGWRTLGLMAAALFALAIALAALTVTYLRRAPVEDAEVHLTFSTPEELTLADAGVGGPVTISPDGQRVAFVAVGPDGGQALWVRSPDVLAAQPLAGTDGAA